LAAPFSFVVVWIVPVLQGFPPLLTSPEKPMRARLATLYRAYSGRSGITLVQSAILAEAACVLSQRDVAAPTVAATIEELEAAFENTPGRPLIPPRPIFGGNIFEFPRR
jgi:hypothetical protein